MAADCDEVIDLSRSLMKTGRSFKKVVVLPESSQRLGDDIPPQLKKKDQYYKVNSYLMRLSDKF
jgi:hypothetical protein